ncbi:hypothetical protein CRYUN_Cryun16bG0033500 [Craigia yunnanensis]
MAAQKKGATGRVLEDPEELARHPLQAILLADSFATKFRPITLERPKVLLPLVNIPMIDYTLAWLESAGVEEVFVFCCAHLKQVIDYLESSEWSSQTNFSVQTIESHNSISAGNALRLIYERHVIHGDFVLIDGDTDCYIDICSEEVLSLFTDNFDYQHLRRHFVKGLLVDDDIIQRWTYPFVPDILSGNSAIKVERQGTYRASEVTLSRSAEIGPFTVIGQGTKIGNDTKISHSVIGEGCTIGSNVTIKGSYIWNNVTIENGCQLSHAIVCDGMIMKSGVVLEPGVVLSFKVVVGQQNVVPAYSMVSLLQQPTQQDSDEELEYADSSSSTVELPSDKLNRDIASDLSETRYGPASELGAGGVGYIWSIFEGGHDEEWKHSVAPIPTDKLAKIMLDKDDDEELLTQDGNALSASGELKSDHDSIGSKDDDNEDSRDDYVSFE